MTHTHHRRGSKASLSNDYIVITRVDRTNAEQTSYKGSLDDRVKKFLQICARHHPIGIACKDRKTSQVIRWMKGWTKKMNSGIHQYSPIKDVIEEPHPVSRAETHVIFTNSQDLLAVIKEVKEADLGLSVVVSGVFDQVFTICEKATSGPHTVNLSLSSWGRTDLLPSESVLLLLTMCGHSMISRHLIEALIEKVKRGKMFPEEAAIELGKQCTCNIFNVERGRQIITEYLGLNSAQ